MGKQRRVELKSVGNFVAKTVLVESANQFSLEELCRTKYSLKYFFSKPCRPSDLWQNLKMVYTSELKSLFYSNFVDLLHHPFWLQLVLALLGQPFSTFESTLFD